MSANPYYDPEKCGLTKVDELEYSDHSYQFDTRVVWKNEQGRLVTARDSGCSCPVPFEEFTDVSKLDDITDSFESFLRTEYKEERSSYVTAEQLDEMIEKCRKALAG